MDIAVILSFLFFMSIFAGVGLASVRVKKDTTDDYLVAGSCLLYTSDAADES